MSCIYQWRVTGVWEEDEHLVAGPKIRSFFKVQAELSQSPKGLPVHSRVIQEQEQELRSQQDEAPILGKQPQAGRMTEAKLGFRDPFKYGNKTDALFSEQQRKVEMRVIAGELPQCI